MASIVKRRKKYAVVYSVGEGSEKKQVWETCENYRDAVRRKSEIEFELQNGTFKVDPAKTVEDLLHQYVESYGRKKWALSTYTSNQSLISNYIVPYIGNLPLNKVTPKVIDDFYDKLQEVTPVSKKYHPNAPDRLSANCIKEVHKIMRSALNQAVRWEYVTRNPALMATPPKPEPKKRDIWTADEIMKALSMCDNQMLYIAINLAFACSMRIGEILGLTWDSVFLDDDSDAENSFLIVEKELCRVQKAAMQDLKEKDVIFVFPPIMPGNTTDLVLKKPKTESSVRKIWIPVTVARILRKWKADQEELSDTLGQDFVHFKSDTKSFDLVISQNNGRPIEERIIRKWFVALTEKAQLPKVVFHSLRHSSTTYKLKLNNGDIKATQGDTGHAQADMVTKVYAHILDEDRKINAQKFEDAFYSADKKGDKKTKQEDASLENLLQKVLESPELALQLKLLLKKATD